MSIVAQVIAALDFLTEVFMFMLAVYGAQFVAFFCEALEKPWLVKR